MLLACVAVGDGFARAQQPLDEWLERAEELEQAPRSERIERLQTLIAARPSDERSRADWLKELRAHPALDEATRLVALVLAESGGQHELAAEYRLDLAAAALSSGACGDARVLLEALDARPVGAWRALVELELAQIARLTHHFVSAQERITRALAASSGAHDTYSEQMYVHALGERVLLELELGRVDHAARTLAQIECAPIVLDAGSAGGSLDLPLTLWRASVLVAQDDHRSAIETCEQWLATASGDDPRRELVRYRRDYAALLFASAFDEATTPALARFEGLLEAPQLSAPERWRGWIECGRALLRSGDEAAARERLERADRVLSTLSNDCAPRIRRTSLALALAALQPDQSAELEAALAAFMPEWEALLEAWREVQRPAGGIGWLHSASSLELLSDLARALCALHGPARGAELAVDALLQAQSVGSLALQLGARAGDLSALRSKLLEDDFHGMLLLVLAPARSLAFAVDRAGVSLHELPGRLRLRELTTPLLAPGASAHEARAAWSAFFPGELATWVTRHSRLTIVGSEQLGAVAFELFLPPGSARLGLTHALDRLPSGPVGLWLREHAARPELGGAALLAVDRPHAELRARFPEAVELRVEGGALAGLLAPWGERAQARIGGGIGLRHYDELVRTAPFVLQWITHGVFDPLHDPATGLALEVEPGVAWAEDFAARAAPPVILLSCCAGARAQMRRGDDGAQQLSSAFFRGGARAVVATAGSTRLSHAVEFARALHRELAAGASVAQAARQARLEMAEDQALDPLAWGAWQVTGLGSLRAKPALPRGVGAWTFVAVALVAVALVWWSVVRKRVSG